MAAIRYPPPHHHSLILPGLSNTSQPEETVCLFTEYHPGSPLGGVTYPRSYLAKLSLYFRQLGKFCSNRSPPQSPQGAGRG